MHQQTFIVYTYDLITVCMPVFMEYTTIQLILPFSNLRGVIFCPSIGECQGQEAGMGRLVNRGWGEVIGAFWRGPEKGIIIDMEIKKVSNK
jgi:hypothetical protein